jgi:hypothetical protein
MTRSMDSPFGASIVVSLGRFRQISRSNDHHEDTKNTTQSNMIQGMPPPDIALLQNLPMTSYHAVIPAKAHCGPE